ncbi:MAG: Gfo/Idh/MocA family oxidoreductase, partial [Lysobacteraceae bacterium]
MGEKVRMGVVGVGDFGRNHVRVYGSLEEVELVGVFDSNAERAREVAAAFQTRAFESLDALAGEVEAASVAVPTREHARVGRALLEQG